MATLIKRNLVSALESSDKFLACLLVSMILAQAGAFAAPIWTYQVVESYPHDPKAYTQGLVYHEGGFFEGTGRNGESTLRRVRLADGRVERRLDLASKYFGEGIAILDGRIYQLTWQSGIGFVYDAESFALQREIQYNTEGWGLAYDGARLIMSDGTDRLYYRDPETFEVTRVLSVTDGGARVTRLNELEWIDGAVWANVWLTDHIVRIDPDTGETLSRIDLTGLLDTGELNDHGAVLNGIAWDSANARLFVTGKLWPRLFEIKAHPLSDPLPPEVEAIEMNGRKLSLQFGSSRGVRYRLQFSSALATEHWTALQESKLGTGFKISMEADIPRNGREGYYRLTASP